MKALGEGLYRDLLGMPVKEQAVDGCIVFVSLYHVLGNKLIGHLQ